MDEIINNLLNETAGADNLPYSASGDSPYLRDRMAELDEEYEQMQKNLLIAVQRVAHKKERELATSC